MNNQTISEALKELNEFDYNDMNDPKEKPVTEAQKIFAKNIFDMIQDIIDNEVINEEFTSRSSLHTHFQNHCLSSYTNRKSSHSNVYYDFTKINEYENYEKKIMNDLDSKPTILIQSLYDTKKLITGFRKLFEGSQSITFLALCGFENSNGPVIISFRAYSNSVTKNYNQNTLDCVVRSIKAKTITLYPIPADKVELKFNSFVQNYNKLNIPPFQINH